MPTARGRTWSVELEVIGLKFRWKKDGRRAIFDMIEKRGPIKGIRLVREPDNKWDENAIMVMLPERILGGKQLGYLRKEAAELLAPSFDSGKTTLVSGVLEGLNDSDEYNSGLMALRFRDRPPAIKRKTARKGAKRQVAKK